MPTLVTYERDCFRPFGEVVLDNGDRIRVAMGTDGVSIERLPGFGVDPKLLFQASPDVASWICVSLQQGKGATASPLDIIVNLVLSLGSVASISGAFEAALRATECGGTFQHGARR
jgi:hypothetical protein